MAELALLQAQVAAETGLAFFGHASVRSLALGDKNLEQEVRGIGKFLRDWLGGTGWQVIGSTLGYSAGSLAGDSSTLNPIAPGSTAGS
jgi:hypothetical protein